MTGGGALELRLGSPGTPSLPKGLGGSPWGYLKDVSGMLPHLCNRTALLGPWNLGEGTADL